MAPRVTHFYTLAASRDFEAAGMEGSQAETVATRLAAAVTAGRAEVATETDLARLGTKPLTVAVGNVPARTALFLGLLKLTIRLKPVSADKANPGDRKSTRASSQRRDARSSRARGSISTPRPVRDARSQRWRKREACRPGPRRRRPLPGRIQGRHRRLPGPCHRDPYRDSPMPTSANAWPPGCGSPAMPHRATPAASGGTAASNPPSRSGISRTWSRRLTGFVG